MAAVTAPDRTAAQHQSLLHFVGQSPWSDEKVLAKVGEMVLPAIESQGPIEAWIIDDTGFPKKGSTRSAWHASTAVSSVSGRTAKWRCRCHSPITSRACRWLGVSIYRKSGRPTLNIDARRASPMRGMPFKTKPEIALEQVKAALKAGLSRGVVLMDAGYGCNTDLRTGISALALTYVAGILPNTTVWTPSTGPLPPKWSGRGQRPRRLRRDDKHKPISVEELALSLPKRSWRRIEWREGTAERLSSRFARVRVRVAHRDYALTESRPEEWLLIK